MFSTKWICAVLLTLIAVTLSAGEKKVHKASLMDYGPFISCTAGAGLNNVSLKGIIVKLEKEKPASICFDTELLRVSAGWTGGYIDWAGTAFNESHGVGPNAVGNFQFATTRNPGWSKDGKFEDPRKEKDGPLPADWAKYKGLFLNGEKVIDFDYTDARWAREVEILRIRGADLAARGAFLRLQDHGQDVWFRSLRWRRIPASETLVRSAFEPMPIPESALQKENARLEQMLKAKRK